MVGAVGGLVLAALITLLWRRFAWPWRAETVGAALYFVMALTAGRVAKPPHNEPVRVLLFGLLMAAIGALGFHLVNLGR